MQESALTEPVNVEKETSKVAPGLPAEKVIQSVQFISDRAGPVRQSGRIPGA